MVSHELCAVNVQHFHSLHDKKKRGRKNAKGEEKNVNCKARWLEACKYLLRAIDIPPFLNYNAYSCKSLCSLKKQEAKERKRERTRQFALKAPLCFFFSSS
jgi:hypothetical protein